MAWYKIVRDENKEGFGQYGYWKETMRCPACLKQLKPGELICEDIGKPPIPERKWISLAEHWVGWDRFILGKKKLKFPDGVIFSGVVTGIIEGKETTCIIRATFHWHGKCVNVDMEGLEIEVDD